MLYEALVNQAARLSSRSLWNMPDLETWKRELPQRRRQWREMLGLDPLPERNDLNATVTGILERDRYRVEKLYYEPLRGARVAANLYVPVGAGPFPGVVYVCGHNETAKIDYQHHGQWFAQNGYVAIVVDAIQIGESVGDHYGTIFEQYWHWYSLGYTPAGVEVWSAMRALDYLQSRQEVDPTRLGITGLSGGGTMSWFTGAADERLTVVAPVCQTGTMLQHIQDRTLDGHCDCTFWVNTYGWDFPDVAALIAPRPLCVGAASEDSLFRPYAYRELERRARQLYDLHGCLDHFKLVEDRIQHGYSEKILAEVFGHFERYLKGSAQPQAGKLPEQREKDEDLWVYPGGKSPSDDRMADVDHWFIPLPEIPVAPGRKEWEAHRDKSLARLRAVTFRHIPAQRAVPECEVRFHGATPHVNLRQVKFESEPGLPVRIMLGFPQKVGKPFPLVVLPMQETDERNNALVGGQVRGVSWVTNGRAMVEVRGTGCTSIGPGLYRFAKRAYNLFGQTLPERRVYDLLRALDFLFTVEGVADITLYGHGPMAPVAIYAALLDERIAGVILDQPVTTHWDGGPEFPRVLQTGDLPHNLALLFPRPITFVEAIPEAYQYTQEVYAKCGAADRITVAGPECEL